MRNKLIQTQSCIAKNRKVHPDFLFIKRMFTSVGNPIENIFQWECAYGMISLYSFKHKDRQGVIDLKSIALEKRKELSPTYNFFQE